MFIKSKLSSEWFFYLDYDQTNIPVTYNQGKLRESLKFPNAETLNVTEAGR
jgi:hypothetical protein